MYWKLGSSKENLIKYSRTILYKTCINSLLVFHETVVNLIWKWIKKFFENYNFPTHGWKHNIQPLDVALFPYILFSTLILSKTY